MSIWFFWGWIIPILPIALGMVYVTARGNGNTESEDILAGCAIGLFWPLLLVIGVVALPFIGVSKLGIAHHAQEIAPEQARKVIEDYEKAQWAALERDSADWYKQEATRHSKYEQYRRERKTFNHGRKNNST